MSFLGFQDPSQDTTLNSVVSLFQSMTIPQSFFVFRDRDGYKECVSVTLQNLPQIVLVFSHGGNEVMALGKEKSQLRNVLSSASFQGVYDVAMSCYCWFLLLFNMATINILITYMTESIIL